MWRFSVRTAALVHNETMSSASLASLLAAVSGISLVATSLGQDQSRARRRLQDRAARLRSVRSCACLCDEGQRSASASQFKRVQEVDTIVIGAGVVGAAAALQLARAQRSVLVVDKEVVGSGATGMSCATIAGYGQGNGTVSAAAMSGSTMQTFKELQAAGYDCGYTPMGVLEIARSEAEVEFAMSSVAELKKNGYDAAYVSADEAVALEPALKGTPGLIGAMHLPDSAIVDPCLAPAALIDAARDAGALFWMWETCKVTEAVSRSDGSASKRWQITVASSEGDLHVACDNVILATGAWARETGKLFGLELPIAQVKAQMWSATREEGDGVPLNHILYACSSHLFFKNNNTRDDELGVPNLVTHSAARQRYCNHLYGRPSPSGGGEVWFGGDRIPLGYASPTGEDFNVDELISDENFDQISRMLPALNLKHAQYGPWSGVVGASMHGAPLVGDLPYMPGLWLCTGFGGSGFMKGPGAAAAVATWICSTPSCAAARFPSVRLDADPAPWVRPLSTAA